MPATWHSSYLFLKGGDKPSYNTAEVPRLDWGLNGFVGCETPEGLYAKVGAELGLKNVQQDPVTGNSARNYNFLFSVGYILGGYHK